MSFNSDLGLIKAIVAHFGVAGVKITITSQAPQRSGLGESGCVAVSLISTLNEDLFLFKGEFI